MRALERNVPHPTTDPALPRRRAAARTAEDRGQLDR
jgi:hypothetical protein